MLVKRTQDGITGMVALQVEDYLFMVNDAFMGEEETAAPNFKSKARVFLKEKVMTFHEVRITRKRTGELKLDQKN